LDFGTFLYSHTASTFHKFFAIREILSVTNARRTRTNYLPLSKTVLCMLPSRTRNRALLVEMKDLMILRGKQSKHIAL
jgi:hypothetical protein